MRINKIVCDGCGDEIVEREDTFTHITMYINNVTADGNSYRARDKWFHICPDCNYYEAVENWAKNELKGEDNG
jgi:predicted Zn-dependent protease